MCLQVFVGFDALFCYDFDEKIKKIKKTVYKHKTVCYTVCILKSRRGVTMENIYLMEDGKRVIKYIPNVVNYSDRDYETGLNKYHLAECCTIKQARTQGFIDKFKTVSLDTELFPVNYYVDGELIGIDKEELELCSHCAGIILKNNIHLLRHL